MILIWFQYMCQTCDLMWVKSVGFASVFERVLKTYQNHIKIVPSLYQNSIKTIKTLEKLTKSLSRGCFCFCFPKPTHREPWKVPEKSAPFPNQIKTISKSYPRPYLNHNLNHNSNQIKLITKSYWHHHPKFKAYQNHILKSYQN